MNTAIDAMVALRAALRRLRMGAEIYRLGNGRVAVCGECLRVDGDPECLVAALEAFDEGAPVSDAWFAMWEAARVGRVPAPEESGVYALHLVR